MIKLINVKSCIKYCCGKSISKIQARKFQDAVERAEVISFDLFDTLIKRNVAEPGHVHKLVQREFFERMGTKLNGYTRYRVDAERRARRCSSKEEISLDDIFNLLYGVPEEWKNTLKKIEKQTEIEICTPNLAMKAVYEKALQAGKHIIITSDMYLDEKTIRQILHKCGYGLYEKLYLSSSFGQCKASGSIYETIKTDYGAYKGKILHIGDNVKGDYFIPRKKGIKALLVDGHPELLRYWRKKDEKRVKNPFLFQRMYCFLNNHVGSEYSDAEAIGLEILGPMLLGYCKWLNQRLKADKIERIFFLSREGKILQDAFQTLCPECEIEQTYLYVSRQALTVPLLADAADFDEMAEIIKRLVHVPTINMIPTVCRLDQKVFHERISGVGLEGTTRIDKVSDKGKMELYRIIQDLGKDDFNRQKEYIVKYLKENEFSGNVAVVDIGWSGTMQKALQAYIEVADTRLQGYYLGVRNIGSDGQYGGLYRHGYLFNHKKNEKFNLMTRFTTEIIELLFLNTSGSVLEYRLTNEHVIPVLEKPEYDGTKGVFITSVQKAALDFIKVAKRDSLFLKEGEIPEDVIMKAYYHFAVHPSKSTQKVFDGFLVFNGKLRPMLPEHGILYYMVHISLLKQDLEESSCKILFLKKIFKINLPYFAILTRLLSKYEKNTYDMCRGRNGAQV